MTKTSKTVFILIGVFAVAQLMIGIALLRAKDGTGGNQTSVPQTDDLVGKPLPNIQLFNQNGQAEDFAVLKGKKVVLFFNEGLMCYPSCWNQMASFGADPRFNNDTVAAFSVIADAPENWQQAVSKMPELSKASMLFDKNANTSRALGLVYVASSMHRGQLPGHSYVLMDGQGVVRDIFDDPNMGLNNDKILQKLSQF